MRCYFHLVNHTDWLPDETGIEIRSPEQAYAVATAAIQDIRSEDRDADWTGWRLEATDPAGLVVFAIDL